MFKAVIAGYSRSPFTMARKGELINVKPVNLLAEVINNLVLKTKINKADIEDIVIGCAFQTGEQCFNIGKLVTFLTDMDIKTDGTDKFKGGIIIGVNDGTKKVFVPGATNDVITMNGSTKGGIVGSVVSFTAIDTATYLVHNSLLIGSGTIVTPFADA